MFRLSNVRIGVKLAAMSAVAILLIAGMVAIETMNNATATTTSNDATRRQTIVQNAIESQYEFAMLQIAVRDLRLARIPAEAQQATAAIGIARDATAGKIDELKKNVQKGDNRERLDKMRAAVDGYVAGAKKIEDIKKKIAEQQEMGAPDSAVADLAQSIIRVETETLKPIREQFMTLSGQLSSIILRNSRNSVAEAHQALAQGTRIVWIVGLLAGAIMIGSVLFGMVSIARPLKALTKPIDELAQGNFNVTVPGVGRKDEVGQIATAVDTMASRVKATIAEIKHSALEVNSASGEISTSTTDLSQRTEEQAASLEETTAAMEEIAATVKHSAENAEQANRSAGAARDVAAQGGEVVAKAVSAMARIEDSSRKISDIIGVIDEIARQTNLLALNAAVEAARAGEAGRGFAVVASEVRSLAQRSSQAAKDIKELITNSNGQVQEGVQLVNHAGAALGKIVESIRDVADLVSDIARASHEQSTGLEQINKALLQMDQVTQQNAALVEENAATAKALETQALAMDERVAFFKLDDAVDARTQAAPAPPAPEAPAATPKQAVAAVVKPAPVRQAARPAPRHPVGRMQTALAEKLDADTEWKDF